MPILFIFLNSPFVENQFINERKNSVKKEKYILRKQSLFWPLSFVNSNLHFLLKFSKGKNRKQTHTWFQDNSMNGSRQYRKKKDIINSLTFLSLRGGLFLVCYMANTIMQRILHNLVQNVKRKKSIFLPEEQNFNIQIFVLYN